MGLCGFEHFYKCKSVVLCRGYLVMQLSGCVFVGDILAIPSTYACVM